MQSINPVASNIPSYKIWSIFSLLCCCLPLGVVATIYSFKSENAAKAGDTIEAEKSSNIAKYLNIAALVIGLIMIITIIAVQATAISRFHRK
ncbi:synapse differentiation-inducing gene protein 1-like [Pristis pectinata]|uniref:synapse differentiation-inducing gene protein 1-like n=1 Tax=Pristis pectinata TaxID=685728 RepID=UPI00223E24EE|nr:synapse differentiation-inducing gene protein 1-like [Pristis pectinata]